MLPKNFFLAVVVATTGTMPAAQFAKRYQRMRTNFAEVEAQSENRNRDQVVEGDQDRFQDEIRAGLEEAVDQEPEMTKTRI